jgi:predicted GNAT family acetyltransferase
VAYRVRRFDAAPDFLAHASPWLLQNEAENNLILSLAERLSRTTAGYERPIYFATVESDNAVVGCALRTPPFKLLLTQLPADVLPALVEDVASIFDAIPAVLGSSSVAEQFARLWASRQGRSVRLGMQQRIYQLTVLAPRSPRVKGELRVADQSDLEVAAQWVEQFTRDTGIAAPRSRELVHDRIRSHQLFFWMEDDVHRSMAAWAGTTPHGVRVGYVFTPPEYRGRGYASACTAGTSQRAFDSGYKFCFLYTDLANPTSNSIYQRLGYTPVADVADWMIT